MHLSVFSIIYFYYILKKTTKHEIYTTTHSVIKSDKIIMLDQAILSKNALSMKMNQVYEQDYLNKAAEVGKTAETGDVVEKVNPKHEEI
jgi:hypothetical protein